MRKILLGYDGSLGAKDAAELCRTLAPEDAYVAVIDVLPFPGARSGMFRLLSGAEFLEPREFFEPAVSRLPGRRVDTLTYLGGSPARVFESFTSEVAIDLIVVGCPRHGAVGRVLTGSVGQALLHGSPVPVATAPRGYAGRPQVKPARIAVAYDGGSESCAALAYGQMLATQMGAGLEILTVARRTDPLGGPLAYTLGLPEDVGDVQRQARREIDPGLDLRCRTLQGETAAALAEACEEDVDLLVVGSRGYGTVDRVLLGSTSAELIHRVNRPLIVVPRAAEHGEQTSVPTASAAGDRA